MKHIMIMAIFMITNAYADFCQERRPMKRREFIGTNGFAKCRDLTKTNLSGLKMDRADFRGALLDGTDLTDTNFKTITLDHSHLQYLQIRGVQWESVEGEKVKFDQVEFENATLSGNIVESDMSQTVFNNSTLIDFSVRSSLVNDLRIENTLILRGSLTSSIIKNLEVNESLLRKTSFSGTKIKKSGFINSTLSQVSFAANNKHYVLVNESQFEEISFKGGEFICWTRFGEKNWKDANYSNTGHSRSLLPREFKRKASEYGLYHNNHNDAFDCEDPNLDFELNALMY